MINKERFEGPVGDYYIARNTIKCLLRDEDTLFYCVYLSPTATVHSTTFLIGHFYFAVISTSTQPISSKCSAFYTDICSYRNPLKLASLFSRSVLQVYHY